MTGAFAAIASLATAPIRTDSPAGDPARYDAGFLRLEEELGKLASLNGGTVDWARVEADATVILGSKSKDLLVAVYLARAWFELRGPAGLRDGLVLVRDLLKAYWETCHPQLARLRARRAALQWFGSGVEPLASRLASDPDALVTCRACVDDLIAFAQGRFEDDDCGLAGLARAFARVAEQAAIDHPAIDLHAIHHPAIDPDAETAVHASRLERPIPLAATSGAIADRDEAIRRLREVADWFQRSEPHGPVGFLVQRAAHWSGLSFQEVFRDLLANNAQAQNELWQALGLRAPE